jgi:glycosyltransferase involved in cell wall biosynthesis
MEKHFYAIFGSFHPNIASTNRLLSYLEVWSKMDINVTLIFMLPDKHFSKLETKYDNIKIVYLWEKFPVRSCHLHRIMFFWHIRRLKRMLKRGDNVYLYGQSYLLGELVNKEGVTVFWEKTEHPEVSNPNKWPYKKTLDGLLKDCQKVRGLFVISNPLKDYFVERGVEPERISIVNMMVDPSRFLRIKKNSNESRYIAYCGNVSNKKDGVDLLIESFARISHKFPNVYLYIIGNITGNKSANSNVLLVEKLGIKEKVVFTGLVPYKDMPQMLKDAEILALNRPNNKQAQYGFPTKLGEYLLTGNPVVITSVGDIPNFIHDGESGMVVEPNNVEEFASKMEWLLEHPQEAKVIGENGRRVALKSFNNEIEAKKIPNIILKSGEL